MQMNYQYSFKALSKEHLEESDKSLSLQKSKYVCAYKTWLTTLKHPIKVHL